MKRNILNPWVCLLAGAALGVISRLLDIYTQNLGNLFSGFSIWILLGVLISIYSPTKKRAAGNVLLFCLGMLCTYYVSAAVTKGVYSSIFIAGWTVFALCSPVMAWFAWMAKEKGVFPVVIRVGILLVSVAATVLFFDRMRFYDYVIDGILVYVLFFKRVKRKD